MTRKRFIKLLMGKGYSRNYAASLTKLGERWKGGYKALYDSFSTLDLIGSFTNTVTHNIIASVCDALRVVAETVGHAIAPIEEHYREVKESKYKRQKKLLEGTGLQKRPDGLLTLMIGGSENENPQ